MARRVTHGAQQALVMGIVLLSCGLFYGFGVLELPDNVRTTVAVLFSAQVVTIVALFLTMMLVDPTHPAARAERKPLKHSTLANATDQTTLRRRIHCTACDVYVSPTTCHCHICNTCIEGFDHHCIYLNVCIGSRNYRLFVALLCCTIMLLSTQLLVTGFALHRRQTRHRTPDLSWEMVLLIISLSMLPLLQLLCLLVLGCFHLYIAYRGVRTHEWLQQFRRRHRWTTSRQSADASDTVDLATMKTQKPIGDEDNRSCAPAVSLLVTPSADRAIAALEQQQ